VKPFFHILGDAVEQEGGRSLLARTALPRLQQDAVEQDRREYWVWSHAG